MINILYMYIHAADISDGIPWRPDISNGGRLYVAPIKNKGNASPDAAPTKFDLKVNSV